MKQRKSCLRTRGWSHSSRWREQVIRTIHQSLTENAANTKEMELRDGETVRLSPDGTEPQSSHDGLWFPLDLFTGANTFSFPTLLWRFDLSHTELGFCHLIKTDGQPSERETEITWSQHRLTTTKNRTCQTILIPWLEVNEISRSREGCRLV